MINWRELTEFYQWCNYNWAMFLLSLKDYCEKGKGLAADSFYGKESLAIQILNNGGSGPVINYDIREITFSTHS
ncbi:hypothetical protein GCM10010967_28860 [Dyadobacter beijingensis]|uniref:Uncharacterized protein n=1 Tax=Dyadobacter beijingensis TaxID=365489 RepID=A0ABQ2HZ05_9BACT|nr:hypothetical protein GCM10010967_28860 [Dyadobacter beijingensis]